MSIYVIQNSCWNHLIIDQLTWLSVVVCPWLTVGHTMPYLEVLCVTWHSLYLSKILSFSFKQLLCILVATLHNPRDPTTMHPSVFKGSTTHCFLSGYAYPIVYLVLIL